MLASLCDSDMCIIDDMGFGVNKLPCPSLFIWAIYCAIKIEAGGLERLKIPIKTSLREVSLLLALPAVVGVSVNPHSETL